MGEFAFEALWRRKQAMAAWYSVYFLHNYLAEYEYTIRPTIWTK